MYLLKNEDKFTGNVITCKKKTKEEIIKELEKWLSLGMVELEPEEKQELLETGATDLGGLESAEIKRI